MGYLRNSWPPFVLKARISSSLEGGIWPSWQSHFQSLQRPNQFSQSKFRLKKQVPGFAGLQSAQLQELSLAAAQISRAASPSCATSISHLLREDWELMSWEMPQDQMRTGVRLRETKVEQGNATRNLIWKLKKSRTHTNSMFRGNKISPSKLGNARIRIPEKLYFPFWTWFVRWSF